MPKGIIGTRMADTSLRLPLEYLQWLTLEAERSSPRVSRNTLIIRAVELLMERRTDEWMKTVTSAQLIEEKR